MTSRLGELKAVVDNAFRQRLEEVVAAELVTELGSHRKTKQRFLFLCRPLGAAGRAGGGTRHTLTVASADDLRSLKIKQVFAVERLADIAHDGDFDATFNFSASGMLSVSFQSHIQREMFIAAVNRAKSAMPDASGRKGGAGPSAGPIRGVLTDAIGMQAEVDAAARVRKLRQEKRRVFSVEEEQHLLKYMGPTGFDDASTFQEVLLLRQKSAELLSVDLLIQSSEDWTQVKDQVRDLIHDVEDLEQRIETYSSHLLSNRGVIQQIEHENNTLQQRQANLEKLYVMMGDLRDQLCLDANTLRLLDRLRTIADADLVAFFSEGRNAQVLSEAMRHMRVVLHSTDLERSFPISAVVERRAYFVEQRRMIAFRSQHYIVSLLTQWEEKYLGDRSRYSRDETLVWRLHTELSNALLNIKDIVLALARIDMEGFNTTLRRYRTSMQKVYAMEVSRFFKCLRKQVRRVSSWKGPFLLGAPQTTALALEARLETAQAGETPQAKMWRHSVSVSPALTPRLMQASDDDEREPARSTGAGSERGHMLSIEFPPSLGMPGVELYANAQTLRRLEAKAASGSVVGNIVGSSTGGYLRPDLAFAIALESAMIAILHEESILKECFGVAEPPYAEEAAVNDVANGSVTVPGALSFDRTAGVAGGGGDTDGEAAPPTNADRELLEESLVELFSGDAKDFLTVMASASSGKGNDGAASSLSRPAAFPRRHEGGSLGGYGRQSDRVSMGDDGASTSSDTLLARHNFLAREVIELASFFVEKCDRIYTVPMLTMVHAYRHRNMQPTRSTFCQAILKDVESILAGGMMRFIAEQTDSISRCWKKFMVKPTALLHCFARMPAFFARMEAVHNALAVNVVDRTEYTSIAGSLVQQSFDALDTVTNVKGTGDSGSETKLKLNELLRKRVNRVFEGVSADINSVKRGFILQYRHHAFFCALCTTLPASSHAITILHDFQESSKMKRDRYEELYLTRVLLVKDFPLFGVFTLDAEDLLSVYSQEELRHHRSLAIEVVKKVVEKLDKEMRSGIKSCAARIKKHFLRDVVPGNSDESFHRTLLQRTWQHFSQLLLQKYDLFSRLLTWPVYRELTLPITRSEIAALLAEY